MCRLSWNALEFTALFLWGNRNIFLYNKQNNTRMLGNMKLFLVLNRIQYTVSHSFALLTPREISWSTLGCTGSGYQYPVKFHYPVSGKILPDIYRIISRCLRLVKLVWRHLNESLNHVWLVWQVEPSFVDYQTCSSLFKSMETHTCFV